MKGEAISIAIVATVSAIIASRTMKTRRSATGEECSSSRSARA